MKKTFILFLSTLLLWFSCKGPNDKPNTPTPDNPQKEDDVSLSELKIEGVSILERMDQNLQCNADDVGTYSILITAKAKSAEAIIKISTSYAEATGKAPNFTLNLKDGENTIKIVSVSSKDVQNKKEYTVKLNKKPSSLPDNESSKIKVLKVDGRDVLSMMDANNVVNLPGVNKDKEKVLVYVEPHYQNAYVRVSNSGARVDEAYDLGKNYFYVFLSYGDNAISVGVTSEKEGEKLHTIKIHKEEIVGLVSFMIEDEEYYDVTKDMLKDNFVSFPSDKEQVSLKLKAKIDNTEFMVKVGDSDVQKEGDVYNIPLKAGQNLLEVTLKIASLSQKYSCTLYREETFSPAPNELVVEVNVSDGVDGTYVDGTYLNIYKTKDSEKLVKRAMILRGKVKVLLEKDVFYDFKLEGGVSGSNGINYAASDVIAYYVDNANKKVPMVQCPLSMVTKRAIAPKMKEFKFDRTVLAVGSNTPIDKMKSVFVKLISSSTIDGDLHYNAPFPMLGVGFVPTTAPSKDEHMHVVSATKSSLPKKMSDGMYHSSWSFYSNATAIKGDVFDVVVVVYDAACNRLEYHARFNTQGATEESSNVKITDLSMEFTSIPTQSTIFSIGQDDDTGSSTHYTAQLKFRCKEGGYDIGCIGFDIYRKCISDGDEDFSLVRHYVYDKPIASKPTDPHSVFDADGLLEENKTYAYKVVGFTNTGKKSSLKASPEIELTVPKSTTVILDYPCNVSVSESKARNLDYVFRLSNPHVLETAKEMELGLLITDRFGRSYLASKFKYVFKDSNGMPELYFAGKGDIQGQTTYLGTTYSKRRSSLTKKRVDELVVIDDATGRITLTSDLVSLLTSKVNLAGNPSKVPYNPGEAYYWDIVDWGGDEYSLYDDEPLKITSSKVKGSTIISRTNDSRHGNNAWNGKAEFVVKKD